MPGKIPASQEKEFDDSPPDHCENVELVVRKRKDMSKTQCFVIILKYYYLLHDDVTMIDILKLQILNKRCYETLVPLTMTQLRLSPEPATCTIGTLEPDIQD